jgi:nephrocystin-3
MACGVQEYLGKFSKKLSPQQTYQLVEKKMTSLPLFLRSILEQLRLFGNFEELGKYIDYFLECRDISSLFEKILMRWETDYNTRTSRIQCSAMRSMVRS